MQFLCFVCVVENAPPFVFLQILLLAAQKVTYTYNIHTFQSELATSKQHLTYTLYAYVCEPLNRGL